MLTSDKAMVRRRNTPHGSWLIFGSEVEANLLSLMHRSPSVTSSPKHDSSSERGERPTGHVEDEDEVDDGELWDSVSELRTEVSDVAHHHTTSRVLPPRVRSHPET